MSCRESKDKLIKEIFPHSEPRVLIEEAKKIVGEGEYSWLLDHVGPAKKGKSAEVVEKGLYLLKISDIERAMRATEDVLELPTIGQLEGVKKTRQFREPSLKLAYLLAVIFFSIGFIPNTLWWLKIVLILLSFFPIWILNRKIFSILEKID